MTHKEKAARIVELLEERYPTALCALHYEGEPWKLLVMGRLSAQCTDYRVNIVCKELLPAFRPVKHWQRESLRKLKVWSAPADSTIPKPPRSKRNAECSPRISAACSPWIWIPS